MAAPELLLNRLSAIASSLADSGHGLALLGLGSVGRDLGRLDAYSDLDFFAIVEDGSKARYIDQLDWLERVAPVAYRYRNTKDGYKLLYTDGVFCEFAVFEKSELVRIPFSAGRSVWKRDDIADSIALPVGGEATVPERSLEWLLGEALTNLYAGMNRYLRGEKLSAARLVQHIAVDRVLELSELSAGALAPDRDPFAVERRAEQRFAELRDWLPVFVQGYQRTPESGAAILDYLGTRYSLDPAMVDAVRQLLSSRQ